MKKELTVIVMTYNQKDYIAKALDSVLSQKTNVDFDILIHDDCSDDGTYQIIRSYQDKFSNKIKIIKEDERRFLKEGFNMMIYNHVVPFVDSKYIAYLDGDDYWCDDNKLQLQYDFMVSHPEYSMCFHPAYQLKRDGDMSSRWFFNDKGDIDMSDVINDHPGIKIATSSIFLTSEVFKDFSDWRKAFPVEDVPMYMTALLYGKVHRFKEPMSVYRQFSSGSWSSQNINNKERVLIHLNGLIVGSKMFDEQTNYKYHELVIKQIESCEFRASYINKNFKEIFSKKYKRFMKRLPAKQRISLKLQYRLPHLYNLVHRKKK